MNTRKLSELGSRVAQVEELLLEVCALVEEDEPLLKDGVSEPKSEAVNSRTTVNNKSLAPPQEQTEELVEEKFAKTEEKTSEIAKEISPVKTEEKKVENPRVKKEEKTEEKKQIKTETSPKSPATRPDAPKNRDHKQAKGKKVETVKQPKLPERNQQISELWQKGLTIQEIARQTGMGQGEVQLIIDLYCNKKPQS